MFGPIFAFVGWNIFALGLNGGPGVSFMPTTGFIGRPIFLIYGVCIMKLDMVVLRGLNDISLLLF